MVRNRGNWQLYDMEADTGETVNLAEKHQDIVNDLATRFLAWQKALPKSPGHIGKPGGRFPIGIGWATAESP